MNGDPCSANGCNVKMWKVFGEAQHQHFSDDLLCGRSFAVQLCVKALRKRKNSAQERTH